MSQVVTTALLLCTVNLKENDYGNSLQNQVQALRGAVRAPHATGVLPVCVGCGEYVETETAIRCPACRKKLNTTQEEFNEQIEVTYMWD